MEENDADVGEKTQKKDHQLKIRKCEWQAGGLYGSVMDSSNEYIQNRQSICFRNKCFLVNI